MNTLTIDIKTRSCASIKTNGVFTYAQNKSTQPICVTVKKNQDPPLVWLPPELRRPEIITISDDRLRQMIEEAEIIQAYDITTEFALWKYTLRRLYPWFPEIPIRKLSCIAARAAYLGMNFSLRNLMEELDIPDNELLFTPMDPIIFISPNKKITTETLSALLKFCMNTVNAESCIAGKLIELPPFEQQIWRSSLVLNDNGIFISRESVGKRLENQKRSEEALRDEFQAITGLNNPMNGDGLLAYFNRQGIHLKNLEVESLEPVLRSMPDSRIRRVLEIRSHVAQNNPLRYSRLISLLGDDSRIRGLWEYHGNPSGTFRMKYLSEITDLNGFMAAEKNHIFRICRLPELRQQLFSVVMNGPDQTSIMTGRNLKEHCETAVNNPGKTVYYGKLKISCFSRFLKIVLPSERDVYLYKPEIKDKQLFCQLKYKRSILNKEISGSFLFHLLEEAMIRDTIMSYLVLLRKNHFTPVITTPYEIVTEDPVSNELDESFQNVIANTPEWLSWYAFSPIVCLSKTWSSAS